MSSPSSVNIGGVFSIIDRNGNLDTAQAENLASVMMALKEINDKGDGYFDSILSSTKLQILMQSSSGIAGATKSALNLGNSMNTTAIVNALVSEEAVIAAQVAEDFGMFSAVAASGSENLGYSPSFSLRNLLSPIDAYQGKVLQELLCNYFNVKKFALLTSNDQFSVKAAEYLLDGSICFLDPMFSHVMMSPFEDMATVADGVVKSKVNAYIIMTPPEIARPWLEEANTAGLLGLNTQIFYLYPGFHILDELSSGLSDVHILDGALSIDYWPDYLLWNSTFLDRWIAQPNTGFDSNSCDLTLDASGTQYLYASQVDQTFCTGLNFSSYSTAHLPNPFVGQMYDATAILAFGIDHLISANIPITGSALSNAIMNDISYSGVTGRISFENGSAIDGFYGHGSRSSDNYYRIWNYQGDGVNPSRFVPSKVWSVENGVTDCEGCVPIVYHTENNANFISGPFPSEVTLPSMSAAGLVVMGALLIIASVVLLVFTLINRKVKAIKAAQPEMLVIILVGAIFSGVHILSLSMKGHDSVCVTQVWTFHLAFALIYGSFFIKTWRVHKIVNNSTLKKIKITGFDIMLIFLGCFSIFLAYLIALTAVGHPQTIRENSYSSTDGYTYQHRCHLVRPGFEVALFVFEAFFLCFGVWLCWKVRDVPDAVNESQSIAGATIILCITCAIVFPIVSAIDLSPDVLNMLDGFCFFFVTAWALFAYFSPKVEKMMKKRELTFGTLHEQVHPDGEKKNEEMVSSTIAMKEMSTRDKMKLCQEQVKKWRLMMLDVSETSSNASQDYAI